MFSHGIHTLRFLIEFYQWYIHQKINLIEHFRSIVDKLIYIEELMMITFYCIFSSYFTVENTGAKIMLFFHLRKTQWYNDEKNISKIDVFVSPYLWTYPLGP